MRVSNSLLQGVSDGAEAIRALQRVCGFKYNHDTILLACLAAATEHGNNEFSASYAALGARMSGEVEPFKKNMTETERVKRRRALQQRFKRAYKRLVKDQEATGLWFVTVQSGGLIDGKRVPSRIRVDSDSVTRTIQLARQADDFDEYRLRSFERAAERVRDSKPRDYTPRSSYIPEAVDPMAQIGRLTGTIKGYARRLYNLAVEEGFDAEQIDDLKDRMHGEIERWFAEDFPARVEADKQTAEWEAGREVRMNAVGLAIRSASKGARIESPVL
jgi:hypothetical protein